MAEHLKNQLLASRSGTNTREGERRWRTRRCGRSSGSSRLCCALPACSTDRYCLPNPARLFCFSPLGTATNKQFQVKVAHFAACFKISKICQLGSPSWYALRCGTRRPWRRAWTRSAWSRSPQEHPASSLSHFTDRFSALEAAARGKCLEGIVDPSYRRLLFYTDPPGVPLASGASFRCFS